MNKQIKFPNKLVWLIFYINIWISSAFAQSGAAMLRIDCNGNNLNTEVYVDGVFRGECPVDIQVQEGVRRLRFYKKIDQRFERVQEQEMRVGAATVKRLEILLPDAQLTAEAKFEEDEKKRIIELQRVELEAKRRRETEEAKRKEEEQFLLDLEKARAGDVNSQFAVGIKYRYGQGVSPNHSEGIRWIGAAAKSGHIPAEILQYGLKLPSDLTENAKEMKKIYDDIALFSEFQGTSITDATDFGVENALETLQIFNYKYTKTSSVGNSSPFEVRIYMGGMVTLIDYQQIGLIFSKTKYSRKLEKILSIYGDVNKNMFIQPGFFGAKLLYDDLTNDGIFKTKAELTFICKRASGIGEDFALRCLTSYKLKPNSLLLGASGYTVVARFSSVYKPIGSIRFNDNPFDIENILNNGLKSGVN